MAQALITDGMLEEAAQALTRHRARRGKCECGSVAPVERHLAEVVAETVGPPLAAEMMELLTTVAMAGCATCTA